MFTVCSVQNSAFCTAHCTLPPESPRSLPTSPDGTQQQPSGPTAEYRTLQTISHAGLDTISARSSLTSDLLQPKLAKAGQPPNQLLRRRPAAVEGPEPAACPTNQTNHTNQRPSLGLGEPLRRLISADKQPLFSECLLATWKSPRGCTEVQRPHTGHSRVPTQESPFPFPFPVPLPSSHQAFPPLSFQ